MSKKAAPAKAKSKRAAGSNRKDGDLTKQAILAAAEVVFASHGFEGANMREIAKEAEVTQALIHYHFANKENLWEEVIKRRSSAINDFRKGLLDQLFANGSTPTLESVLGIFYAPTAYTHGGSTKTMVPYAQLAITTTIGGDKRSQMVTKKYFDGIAYMFIDAFQKCVPGLSLADAVLGYLFALGARAHVHARNGRMARLSSGACSNDNLEDVVKRVIPFAAAGIRQLAVSSNQT